MNTSIFEEYNKNHLLCRGLLAKNEWDKLDDNNYFVKYCELYYSTFIENFIKNIEIYKYWFGENSSTFVIDSYFNTNNNEDFLFRYSNIITLLFTCIFLGESTETVNWSIVNDYYHECIITFANGVEGRISFVYIDIRDRVTELKSGKPLIELETAMTRDDITELNKVLHMFGLSSVDLGLEEIVQSLNISANLQKNNQKEFNTIVFYHSSNSDENYSINALPRILYSRKNGLLENEILQEEYGITKNARKEISDILVYKKNAYFLVLGNFMEISQIYLTLKILKSLLMTFRFKIKPKPLFFLLFPLLISALPVALRCILVE